MTESNRRPLRCQRSALTNCANRPRKKSKKLQREKDVLNSILGELQFKEINHQLLYRILTEAGKLFRIQLDRAKS